MRFVVSRGGRLLSLSFGSTISNVFFHTTEEWGGGSIGPESFAASTSTSSGTLTGVALTGDTLAGVALTCGGALAGDVLAVVALARDVLTSGVLTCGDALAVDALAGSALTCGGALTGCDTLTVDGTLTGGALTDAKDEPLTSGEEGEPQSTEGTAVTAVTLPPVVRGPCICWAEGSDCELQGRGNMLGST